MHRGHHMQAEVIGVLRSFLMFDPSFKNLQLVQNYIGLDSAVQVKYGQEILMSLLLIVYKVLTPIVMIIHDLTKPNVFELKVFGSLTSTEKIALGFLKVELSLFQNPLVSIDPFNPFIWWVEHE
jgi:hypothetical protein